MAMLLTSDRHLNWLSSDHQNFTQSNWPTRSQGIIITLQKFLSSLISCQTPYINCNNHPNNKAVKTVSKSVLISFISCHFLPRFTFNAPLLCVAVAGVVVARFSLLRFTLTRSCSVRPLSEISPWLLSEHFTIKAKC